MVDQSKLNRNVLIIATAILVVAMLVVPNLAKAFGNGIYTFLVVVLILIGPVVGGFLTCFSLIPWIDALSEKDPDPEYDRQKFPWYTNLLIFLAAMAFVSALWVFLSPGLLSFDTWARSFFEGFGWSDPVDGVRQYFWGIISIVEFVVGWLIYLLVKSA